MTLDLITSMYECVTMMAVDVGHLPGSAEYVVVVVQLEVVMGGHGMVDPPVNTSFETFWECWNTHVIISPKPCGDEIGEEHVDGVMASRHHQRGHTWSEARITVTCKIKILKLGTGLQNIGWQSKCFFTNAWNEEGDPVQDGEPSRGILLDCKITPEGEFWYYLIYCKMTPYKYRSYIYCCTSLLSVSSAMCINVQDNTLRKKL